MTAIKDNVLSAFDLLWTLDASDMRLEMTLSDLVSVPGVSKVSDLFALGHPIEVGFFALLPNDELEDDRVIKPEDFDFTADPKVLAKSILVALDPRFEQWDLDSMLITASQKPKPAKRFDDDGVQDWDPWWNTAS